MNFNDSLLNSLDITSKTAEIFNRAGITNLRDLLFHLPLRYEDRSRITPIAALREGMNAQILGTVLHADLIQRRKKIWTVSIQDDAGAVCRIVYFNSYPGLQNHFVSGRRGLFYGKVNAGISGMQMSHPEVYWLSSREAPKLPRTLSAIYPTAKGLSQKLWRTTINKALQIAEAAEKQETDILTVAGFMPFIRALYVLHQPQAQDVAGTFQARQRLITEELCAHRLSVQAVRAQIKALPAVSLQDTDSWVARFIARLPFNLTPAQQQVWAEIRADLQQETPMLRLVQGDVGSGKTVVALLACLQAVSTGKQAVFMAPTELLAEQHYQTISRLSTQFPVPVNVVMLAGKITAAKKRQILHAIATGAAQIIVGTHALFQQTVSYANLALVVIDEQHRFGVHQRLQLQNKVSSVAAHQLILTATPIPRTLAMSCYGELDTSVIDTLPGGRKPIQTGVMSNTKREAIVARVGEVCRQGQQAYWVCPLIEESDALECENAEQIAAQLQKQLPDIRIALLHGRMRNEQRQEIMQAFIRAEVQLLVATTVIEVGVDVANASLMIIENAERFGLAQLHQLRGRVGRGSQQSYCLLIYQAPLSQTAQRRLNIMRETTDGFRIAEEDLAIRGAGELLGIRQTGDKIFRIAALPRDEDLLPQVNHLAEEIRNHAPQFGEKLLARWVGGDEQYLKV